MNFSAVILAGGQSRRMGRDKAFLEIDGKTLLARQLETVRVAGAAEMFISGRVDADYSAFGCRVLPDQFTDAGPLAGVEAALAVATNPLLLVLAVDLPGITAKLLFQLKAGCPEKAGAIPRVGKNLEPLAAFYPKTARPIAEKRLRHHDCAVKDFADECVQSGLAQFVDFPLADAIHFKNYNSPADLPCPV
jgi:molybdopterin-guanine dinucleotide biosynthesis protein A